MKRASLFFGLHLLTEWRCRGRQKDTWQKKKDLFGWNISNLIRIQLNKIGLNGTSSTECPLAATLHGKDPWWWLLYWILGHQVKWCMEFTWKLHWLSLLPFWSQSSGPRKEDFHLWGNSFTQARLRWGWSYGCFWRAQKGALEFL